MGTIAARDCVRIIELTEQVAAACLLAMTQALDLRVKSGELLKEGLKPVEKTVEQVHDNFDFLVEDRPLESDLRKTVNLIRDRHWSYEYE